MITEPKTYDINGHCLLLRSAEKESCNFIWDLDGTLLDSYASIVENVLKTFSGLGIGLDSAEVLHFVKDSSVNDFLMYMDGRAGLSYAELKRRFAAINEVETQSITLIPHARETLEALRERGHRSFVFTHRGRSIDRVLPELGIAEYFGEIISTADGFPRKPEGGAVEYLVEKYALDKSKTYYVGDRTLDMECAANAGIKGIMFLEPGSRVKPIGTEDYVVSDLTEIAQIFT